MTNLGQLYAFLLAKQNANSTRRGWLIRRYGPPYLRRSVRGGDVLHALRVFAVGMVTVWVGLGAWLTLAAVVW